MKQIVGGAGPLCDAAVLLLLVVLVPALAFAETVTVTPEDDVATAMTELQPGDVMVFEEGTYTFDSGLDVALDGLAGQPITLRGADGVRPTLETTAGDFAVRLTGTRLTLEGVEVRGGDAAVVLDAAETVVRDLLISDARVGVRCVSCTGVAIELTEFTNLGAGGGAAVESQEMTFSDVRFNWIHDLVDGADGIVVTGESWGNTVTDNIIETIPASGIRNGYPTDSAAAGVATHIGGNWVRGTGDSGIVVDGRADVANNIVSAFRGAGIHATIGTPGGGTDFLIAHNTVVGGDQTCFRATDWALAPEANVLANNALYCVGGVAIRFDAGGGAATVVTSNVYLGEADVPGDSILGNSLGTDLEAPSNGNFYPTSDSPLVDFALDQYVVAPDFNGDGRPLPADAGAYERTASANPAPSPGGGFKGDEGHSGSDAGGGTPPGADGGGSGGGATSPGGGTGFPPRDTGCSCSTGESSALLFLPLLGLFLLGRRRQRRSE